MRLRALRARLGESLFPDVPAAATGVRRGEQTVLFAAVLVLGTVLQLLRPGFSASLDSLWAEDGPIFLQGALSGSFGETVLTPYAGYLVLVPRLIAEATGLFPLQDAAAVISILAATAVAVSGLAVWYASAAHIRNPHLRAVLAALTVLVPVAGLESLDTAAYVPWYMLFATFWLLLWRPATTGGAVLAALFILATALSTPGVWFFVPLALLRAVAVRDRRDAIVVGSFAAGAVAQVPVVLFNQEQAPEAEWSFEIVAAYAQRVVDGAALGERLGGIAWEHLGVSFLIVLGLAVGAGLVLGFRRSGSTGRWLAAIAVPTSLLLFVVSAYQRGVGSEIAWGTGSYHGSAGRYAIVPALLLVSAALALIDNPKRRRPTRGRHSWAVIATAALLMAGLVTSFDQREYSYRGTPPWSDSLRSAASACVAADLADIAVPISPPPFGLQVPCDRIE